MQLAGLRNNLREMMLKLPLVSTPPCLACLCMSSHSSEADEACYWLKCVMNSTAKNETVMNSSSDCCIVFLHKGVITEVILVYHFNVREFLHENA